MCSHEDPGETGMITICTEYECEVKESQKKPVNLLDALEQGGHCSGEDSNPVTGEVALEIVPLHSFCPVKRRRCGKYQHIKYSIADSIV